MSYALFAADTRFCAFSFQRAIHTGDAGGSKGGIGRKAGREKLLQKEETSGIGTPIVP
jgi:hypothetical protein